MIPPLMLATGTGPVPADQWTPTEIPGLAVALLDDRWHLVHIRSGLSVASDADRRALLELALPIVAAVDFTDDAATIERRAKDCKPLIKALDMYHWAGRQGDGSDIAQDPALAALVAR